MAEPVIWIEELQDGKRWVQVNGERRGYWAQRRHERGYELRDLMDRTVPMVKDDYRSSVGRVVVKKLDQMDNRTREAVHLIPTNVDIEHTKRLRRRQVADTAEAQKVSAKEERVLNRAFEIHRVLKALVDQSRNCRDLAFKGSASFIEARKLLDAIDA